MLGELLGIGHQIPSQDLVLGLVGAPPPCARDRAHRHRAIAQADQDLGARAHQRVVAEVEEEQERGRIEPAQRAVERERRQAELEVEPLRGDHLEDVAGADVLLRPLDHRMILLAGDVGPGLGRRARHPQRLVADAAAEVGDGVGEPLARLAKGLPRRRLARPDRRDQGDLVLDVVEQRHHRRTHEHRIGQAEVVRICVRQALDQPDHVVAHLPEQTCRHQR